MRPRSAVILAARRERDSDVPYPLIPFSGVHTLLGRILEQLDEYAFERIYIVVGYRAELFLPYQTDKIRVIENANYELTSSMASLACVAEYIQEDFVLIEADTFYEKKVLEQLIQSPQPNCFVVSDESGSGDEAFVEAEQGFIHKVSKDPHQICRISGELLGISKISYATYLQMLEKWRESNNPRLNYEYLLLDCTTILQRPYIHFRDLIWGDVDCKSDFDLLQSTIYPRLRRREDPFDIDNLHAHIKEIFPSYPISSVQLEQIGGMSNRNYHVKIGEAQYVLRIPGLGSEGMVDRADEELNSRYASSLGINPPMLYFNAKTGVKLVDYIQHSETLNAGTIQRYENLKQVALVLKSLHQSSFRLSSDFNVFREIQKYESLVPSDLVYSDYSTLKAMLPDLERRLNNIGIHLRPCHNDLVPENFLREPSGRVYLIDWEYSGMNDPVWDIAALFLESRFTEENRMLFLKLYLCDEGSTQALEEKVLIYQILMDTLWALWTCVKEASGEDFGTYGLERLSRALKNLNYWREHEAN